LRILYISDFRPMPRLVRTEEYIAKALEGLGHEVIRFQTPSWRRRKRIAEHAPDLLLVNHRRDMPRRWVRAPPSENPGSLVVQWIFDYLRVPAQRESKWFLPRARTWDLSFLKDRERFPAYRAEGIDCHWLHQGAPPGLPFATERDPAHECDVAFLGNPHNDYRLGMLKRIQDEGFRLNVYTNPIHFKKWRKAGIERVLPALHDAEMGPVCASATFVLGVGCFPDEWEGFWSSRPYLTLASGGLFLTQYVRGMEEHFEHDRHLLWWKDIDECLELIRRYGALADDRERIRREGYAHVHAHHSYEERCREFISECERRLRGRSASGRAGSAEMSA